jgi:hypothetical protein
MALLVTHPKNATRLEQIVTGFIQYPFLDWYARRDKSWHWQEIVTSHDVPLLGRQFSRVEGGTRHEGDIHDSRMRTLKIVTKI